MNIGALGTGNMARNLLGRWAQAGHAVFFGSRDSEKARAVANEIGHGAQGGTNDDAAAFAEVLLHSVRVPPREFLERADALDGKILVDLNNHDFPRDHVGDELIPSLAERVQQAHPQARVVKAFNTMAMEVFDHEPEALRRQRVSTFLAGNDDEAVQKVAQLSEDLGLHPVVMGGLQAAWLIEAQGDFIRTLIFRNEDPYATVSTRSIDPPGGTAFGGRRQGAY